VAIIAKQLSTLLNSYPVSSRLEQKHVGITSIKLQREWLVETFQKNAMPCA